jgi:hypothetical protein
MAGERFLDDAYAAMVSFREAFKAEETTAYVADESCKERFGGVPRGDGEAE